MRTSFIFLNEQFYLLVLNIINVEKENTVYMYKLTGQAIICR